jgi:hypothetical protein
MRVVVESKVHAVAQARGRNALDHPRSGPRQRHLKIDRAPALPDLCAAIVDYPKLLYPYLKKEMSLATPFLITTA